MFRMKSKVRLNTNVSNKIQYKRKLSLVINKVIISEYVEAQILNQFFLSLLRCYDLSEVVRNSVFLFLESSTHEIIDRRSLSSFKHRFHLTYVTSIYWKLAYTMIAFSIL